MKTSSVYLLSLLLLTTAAYAAIDLSDFDENTMRDVEDASKELDSSIASKDVEVAVSNAEFIRDSLHWAEGYFAKKGNVDDAVKLAKQGQTFAAAVAQSANAKDFNAAYDSYISLKKTCKSCHDAYKPPSL